MVSSEVLEYICDLDDLRRARAGKLNEAAHRRSEATTKIEQAQELEQDANRYQTEIEKRLSTLRQLLNSPKHYARGEEETLVPVSVPMADGDSTTQVVELGREA